MNTILYRASLIPIVLFLTLSFNIKNAFSKGKPTPKTNNAPIQATFYSPEDYSYAPYISKFQSNTAQISTKIYTPPPTPTPKPIVQNTPQIGTNLPYSGCGTNFYQNWIYEEESGCSTTEYNSIGCLGLAQACPGSKLLAVCPTETYSCENQYFTNYMIARYGTWQNAYNFHIANGWW